MLPDKLAFVDIETTGTSSRYGRIIEIGIVRVEENEIVHTYHSLINPQTSIPQEIEMLTGITMQDLEDKPIFRQVKNDILEALADAVFVAHNVRFDYSFLKYEFKRENIDFALKHFCTVRLSRALYPTARHHNLDALIERFGFRCENRHRAFDDAKILWDFYRKMQTEFAQDVFLKAVNSALRRPSVPLKLKQEDLDTLPEQPGVYIFYGEKGMPLYVGKSINIRDRVLSHFTGDIHSNKELNIAQQITSIETQITAGELGALFLESKLIKKMLPLYNKVLRIKRELIALTKIVNTEGFITVGLESVQKIDPDKLETYIGFFKSRKEAKTFLYQIADEFGLCEKLLGIESANQGTNTACFAHRLNRCKGACIGKEKPLYYNLRFTTACYKTKIKPWPFHGPIIIEEKNDLTGFSEYFLIDKWCYLGQIKIEHTDHSINNLLQFSDANLSNNGIINPANIAYTFDLDMYKILVRYLNKAENNRFIRNFETNQLLL